MGFSIMGLLHMALFTVICFMALVSHGKGNLLFLIYDTGSLLNSLRPHMATLYVAMLTDPGAVPESALPVALANAPKADIARFVQFISKI